MRPRVGCNNTNIVCFSFNVNKKRVKFPPESDTGQIYQLKSRNQKPEGWYFHLAINIPSKVIQWPVATTNYERNKARVLHRISNRAHFRHLPKSSLSEFQKFDWSLDGPKIPRLGERIDSKREVKQGILIPCPPKLIARSGFHGFLALIEDVGYRRATSVKYTRYRPGERVTIGGTHFRVTVNPKSSV